MLANTVSFCQGLLLPGGLVAWYTRFKSAVQIRSNSLVVLPEHLFQAAAYPVNHAKLDARFWIVGSNRLSQSLETVNAGHQHVLYARVF